MLYNFNISVLDSGKKLPGFGIAECRRFLTQIKYSELAINYAANELSYALGLQSMKRP